MHPIIVNDASCLIDLRKAGLLRVCAQLPYQLIIPLPVRAFELLDFGPKDWAILEQAGMQSYDLPPAQVAEVMRVKATHPALSVYDCFCVVTARRHVNAILLTGDGLLRRIAKDDGQRVHGVLWVIDEIGRLQLTSTQNLIMALECWQADPAVFLPNHEIERRIGTLSRLSGGGSSV
jgi:predicted nucleic acid-binding protein